MQWGVLVHSIGEARWGTPSHRRPEEQHVTGPTEAISEVAVAAMATKLKGSHGAGLNGVAHP